MLTVVLILPLFGSTEQLLHCFGHLMQQTTVQIDSSQSLPDTL